MLFDGTVPPAMEVNLGPGIPDPVVDPLLRPLLSAATVPIENPEIGFTTSLDGGWDA